MENKEGFSCVDCGVTSCRRDGGAYPDFCLSQRLSEEEKEELRAQYLLEENCAFARAAAQVEFDGYCRQSRVEETVELAKRIGAKRIGIATCVGLIGESRTLARILRSHGFEVIGVACKAGEIPKTDVGLDPKLETLGKNICNPILQARILNEAKTDLNIVMGLCVGHDSLFYKYADGWTTTLVAKDRVTGHNPAAALYTASSYYKKLLD